MIRQRPPCVCARCGATVTLIWTGNWKHCVSRSGEACGQKPIVILRSEWEKAKGHEA